MGTQSTWELLCEALLADGMAAVPTLVLAVLVVFGTSIRDGARAHSAVRTMPAGSASLTGRCTAATTMGILWIAPHAARLLGAAEAALFNRKKSAFFAHFRYSAVVQVELSISCIAQ